MLVYARNFGILLSIYVIVVVFRGFLFASNDLVDVMSYAKFLSDPNLYPADFYIQNIQSTFPNERWIFSNLLSLTGENIQWLSFCFHACTTFFLFYGMYRISSLYIRQDFLRWLPILFITGPLYQTNPGACDIYYNMFISSLLAKSIGVWAIYYYLKGSSFRTFLLLIPATLIHPTVGAQLFIILAGTSVIRWKMVHKGRFFTGILLYFFTAGIYIAVLQWKMNQNSGISPEQFFEIFEFRIAHHFFPSYFPIKTYLIASVLWSFSIVHFYRKKAWNLLTFQFITLAGMALYTVFTEIFQSSAILSTQWFKTSIWLQLIAVIALVGWIDNGWEKRKNHRFYRIDFSWLIPIIAIVITGLMMAGQPYFSEKKHEFFFTKFYSDEAEIALQAKKRTPEDAVFITPVAFTEFKYFSERSLYIDYKSVVHRKDVLGEWYKRIGEIYGIDLQNRRDGDDLFAKAESNFKKINPERIEKLRRLGIQYMVSTVNKHLPYRKIASNKTFAIYDLNNPSNVK